MPGIRLNKQTKTIKVVNRRANVKLQKAAQANLRLQHTGKIGPAGTVQVGAVTTLAPGEQARIVNTGTLQQAVLEFFLPKGDKGDKGDTGHSTFNRAHHGSDPNFARPNALYVEWVGSVAPANATVEDTWVEVAAPVVI